MTASYAPRLATSKRPLPPSPDIRATGVRAAGAGKLEAQGGSRSRTMDDGITNDGPSRRLTLADQLDCVPVYVVWEITLACNLKCIHCGSRAGHRSRKDLSPQERFNRGRHLGAS